MGQGLNRRRAMIQVKHRLVEKFGASEATLDMDKQEIRLSSVSRETIEEARLIVEDEPGVDVEVLSDGNSVSVIVSW